MTENVKEIKPSNQRNKLYAAATAELRESHRAEFDSLVEKQYVNAGLTYTRRLSAEERAERDAAIKLEKARQKAAKLKAEFGDDLFATDVTPF